MTEWISIKDSKPEEDVETYLLCQYENGNRFTAIGFMQENGWQFEYSSEYPEEKYIKYWLKTDWDELK